MKRIVKGREPQSLLAHRLQSFADYNNYSDKDELRASLLTEQGHICCYCMQRISDYQMKIVVCSCALAQRAQLRTITLSINVKLY